ncbi:MAG: hypothetical protein GX456_08830 [Verrucomicrobia bacterium]|nr:hypothetical protein [Verrucomicrobiota bacterium]
MASFGLAADSDGFSRAAADAVGVGRREAFGVRQLAAALFSCPNNVSGTISAWRPKQSACPHIGIPRKATCLALYWSQHPDNEPVTLFL